MSCQTSQQLGMVMGVWRGHGRGGRDVGVRGGDLGGRGHGRVGGTWACGGVDVGARGRGTWARVGDLGMWVLEERSGQPPLLKGKPISFPAPGVVITIQVFRLPCSDPGKAISRICNELLV